MNKKNKALQFHIEQGDYFGTLATILDLMRQGIMKESDKDRILQALVNDLVYLQNHFKIIGKSGPL